MVTFLRFIKENTPKVIYIAIGAAIVVFLVQQGCIFKHQEQKKDTPGNFTETEQSKDLPEEKQDCVGSDGEKSGPLIIKAPDDKQAKEIEDEWGVTPVTDVEPLPTSDPKFNISPEERARLLGIFELGGFGEVSSWLDAEGRNYLKYKLQKQKILEFPGIWELYTKGAFLYEEPQNPNLEGWQSKWKVGVGASKEMVRFSKLYMTMYGEVNYERLFDSNLADLGIDSDVISAEIGIKLSKRFGRKNQVVLNIDEEGTSYPSSDGN